MNYQRYIVEATLEAAKEVFRYAKQVPEDKLDWAPAESARTVLSILREVAWTCEWATDILSGKPMEWSEEAMAKMKEVESAWKTVDDCEGQFQTRYDAFAALCAQIPDERLTETKWLPFDGGRDFTFLEMMGYPRWNFTYHLGQIAYIQTIYGDKAMY